MTLKSSTILFVISSSEVVSINAYCLEILSLNLSTVLYYPKNLNVFYILSRQASSLNMR